MANANEQYELHRVIDRLAQAIDRMRTTTAPPPVVHVEATPAALRRVRITVNRDNRGLIESLDVQPLE